MFARQTRPWIAVLVLLQQTALPLAAPVQEGPVEAQEPIPLAKLRVAAEAGDSEAQYELGMAYFRAEGVAQDPSEALAWFRKAGEQGHPGAQLQVGIQYFYGLGTPEDDEKAVAWFERAAVQELPEAYHYLGLCHLHGYGVAKNARLAREWLVKRARKEKVSFRWVKRALEEHGLSFELPSHYFASELGEEQAFVSALGDGLEVTVAMQVFPTQSASAEAVIAAAEQNILGQVDSGKAKDARCPLGRGRSVAFENEGQSFEIDLYPLGRDGVLRTRVFGSPEAIRKASKDLRRFRSSLRASAG